MRKFIERLTTPVWWIPVADVPVWDDTQVHIEAMNRWKNSVHYKPTSYDFKAASTVDISRALKNMMQETKRMLFGPTLLWGIDPNSWEGIARASEARANQARRHDAIVVTWDWPDPNSYKYSPENHREYDDYDYD